MAGRYAFYGMLDLPQFEHLKEERKQAAEYKRVKKNYINSVFGGGSKSKKVSKNVSSKDEKKSQWKIIEKTKPEPKKFSLWPEREPVAKPGPSRIVSHPKTSVVETQKKIFCGGGENVTVSVRQGQKKANFREINFTKNSQTLLIKTATTSHKRKFVDSDDDWSDVETPKSSRPSSIPVPKNNSSDSDDDDDWTSTGNGNRGLFTFFCCLFTFFFKYIFSVKLQDQH